MYSLGTTDSVFTPEIPVLRPSPLSQKHPPPPPFSNKRMGPYFCNTHYLFQAFVI